MLQDIIKSPQRCFPWLSKNLNLIEVPMINVLIQNDTKNGAPGDFSLLAPINDLCFNINLFYARAQKSLSSVISLVTESSQTKITEGCFHSRPLKNNANKIPPNSFHRNFAKISDGKVK